MSFGVAFPGLMAWVACRRVGEEGARLPTAAADAVNSLPSIAPLFLLPRLVVCEAPVA